MTRRVLVVGHADADGHLIAEQVRRNLGLIAGFDVRAVVDPVRTKDHKSWMKLNAINEIADADLVFFVDLMFAPATFDEEATALVDFVQERPTKQFFLIDHHPLPLRRLGAADNLRVVYRPDVFECAIGPRSGMMIVAALCENQGRGVADIKQPVHELLARGVRRAAAYGGQLPGEKLLALLKSDRWDSLSLLANDDKEFHRLPRGRRSSDQRESEALRVVNETAVELLGFAGGARTMRSGRTAMAYDLDIGQERFTAHGVRRTRLQNAAVNSKDLEVIVTLLEIAALSLTTGPDATFTIERLIDEARGLAGDEINLDENDVKIVLKKANFLVKVGGDFRLK